ncbi:NADH-quinone oxidoreductase subunit NuoG [Sandaracinobacter sp. RS1-74]|uniref:NADH-quinone oxidoreductase subunit NuoG n=1 Tax=Sandaracinobacteroides sayramensis TaxID=2913411 RepID=UPI001EDB11AF|nr:NADH-quinone oxidoreductase subunit NuoG [Sandaracinobacteroides sayramensis]MCG2842393.1 NADH-quinone oxidoreductase subunit NuoG [Sandaracinobacteroides sayramensis]
MPKVTVDGIEVEVPAGATVMQACEAAGKEIPRFCYHERLSIAGNCRMCLVEVSPGPPKPQASCALPAAEGQVILTESPKVKKAREGVMEFLLINHPLDCPICDQGGECDLQDQAMAYGRGGSRFEENKRAVTEKHMGPLVKTVMTRCIHCTRCVRFIEEVAGTNEVGALYRGENMQITSYLEQAVASEISGNVIDLCPVGALTSKPTAFNARPWELKRTDSIDVMDAVGTNIVVGSRSGAVVRVTPRVNDDVNEEWLADTGRFGVDGLKERRLDRPWVRVNGELQPATWGQAFAAVKAALADVPGERIAALAGNLSAVEELVAAKDLLAGFGASRLESRTDGAAYQGPAAHWRFNSTLAGIETADVILLVGADPRYDAPLVNSRIRKAVRRRGAAVFRIGAGSDPVYDVTQLGDDLSLLADLPAEVKAKLAAAERPAILIGSRNASAEVLAAAHALSGLFVKDGWNGFNILHDAASRVGALTVGWAGEGVEALAANPPAVLFLLGVDEVALARFAGSTKIYVGSHGDRGAAVADIILPAAAWSEKPGTYLNMEGRVQRALRATFPPGDAREDWTIFRALADVLGITLGYDNLEQLRARIAREWPELGAEALTPAAWEAAAPGAGKPAGAAKPRESDFYSSNPILRASPTMRACVAEILEGREPLLEAAE